MLCKCGCGKKVNPGRSFVHGHNRKNGVTITHSAPRPTLKLKPGVRPMATVERPPAVVQTAIDLLVDRRDWLNGLIKELETVR